MINKGKDIITSFFTKGHERTLLAKKNIAASFVIKVVTMLITFISYPLTLNYLNPVRNGIWLTLISIIAWILLLDIGLGSGLKNKFAEAKARGELLLARKYVSSTYIIFGIMMLALMLIFTIINPFIDWAAFLNVPGEYANELSLLVWIMFISFCCMFVLRLIVSIVVADQRIALGSFIDMFSQLLGLAGIFILVKTTDGSLIRLGYVMGIVPVVVYLIATIYLFSTKYKQFRPSFHLVDLKLSRQMVNLGLKFFVATMSSMILFQTTNILISKMTDPYEVTVYNTAFKIFNIAYSIFFIVVAPYWSAYSDAYTLKDYDWMKQSYKKLVKMFGISILGLVALLFLSDWIYLLWIKEAVTVPFPMSMSVCFYVCSLCWTATCIYPINGIGKIQLQLYSSVFEMILIIPLAIFLGAKLGAIGIVLAPFIVSIPRMIWSPIQMHKLTSGTAKGIWNK